MFRNLIPALQARYHVIAPDYPGFGHSDTPARSQFSQSSAKEITTAKIKEVAAHVFQIVGECRWRSIVPED
jgi:pimeloyl-ACP methyl ester carboxylesterase